MTYHDKMHDNDLINSVKNKARKTCYPIVFLASTSTTIHYSSELKKILILKENMLTWIHKNK
jgi:hypothetical protein